MGENDKPKQSWLGETVIAFAIPIIGYAFAFVSEFAYFNYFKMPSDLIEISFTTLFNSILMSLMIVLFMFYFSFILFHKNKDFFETNKIRILMVYIIPLLSIAIFGFSLYLYRQKKYEILFIIFFILFVFFTLVIDFLKYAKQREYFPSSLFFYLIFISILLLTLFINGERMAKTQKEYFILKTCPERIILKMYKDIMIVAPFDRMNKIIDPTYTILKTPDITSPIKLERIGEMKVGYESGNNKTKEQIKQNGSKKETKGK